MPEIPVQRKLIQLYYRITPFFILLDLCGLNLRVPPLLERPAGKWGYYAFCFACMGLTFWRPALSALAGVLESSLNIVLLVLGMILPLFSVADLVLAGDPAADQLITPQKITQFLFSCSICILSFEQYAADLRRQRGQ